MKLVLLLCFCFIVTASEAHYTATVGVFMTTLISQRMTFPLDTVQDDNDDVSTSKTTMKIEMIEDDDTKLRRCYLECINETHVKPELVIRFKAGKWTPHPSLKQWALCVLVRVGLMSRQAVYQYDTAMSKISNDDKEAVDKLLDHCLSKQAKPPNEIAWQYLNCHHKRDRKNRFPSLGIYYSL